MQLLCTAGPVHMTETMMAAKTSFVLFYKHEPCCGGGFALLHMYVCKRNTNTREQDGPLSSGIIHVSANKVEALIKHLLPFEPSTSSHSGVGRSICHGRLHLLRSASSAGDDH